jgi:hypothetical protein
MGKRKDLIRLGLIALLLVGTALRATAQDGNESDFATGDIPLPAEELAKFPHTPTYRAFLPERVDLSLRLPPIGDQGEQGSCVAWAVGYAARAYYVSALERRDVAKDVNVPSPSFIYNSLARGECNAGTKVPLALELLKSGAPSKMDMRYDAGQCTAPNEAQLRLPRDFYIEDFFAVDRQRPDQIKSELARGHPVIISLHTTRAFKKLRGDQVYTLPASEVQFVGSHALTVVGYDERRQAFRVANSWGTRWGDRGFGWIAYRVLMDEDHVSAAWVMRPKLRAPDPVPRPDVPPIVVIPHPRPEPEPQPSPIQFAGIECGKLNVIRRRGGQLVSGFVGSEADLAKVRAQAASANLAVEVDLRPWPQCEALLTLDEQLAQSDAPKARILHDRSNLQAGGFLQFEIETPSYPSFLHVSYIQADGSVVNLVQPDNLQFRPFSAGTKIVLGGEGGGPRFRVSSPFGREMLIVIASRSPVFGRERPPTETEREFLTALRAELLRVPAPNKPPRTVAAAYDTVLTADLPTAPTEPR